MPHPSLQDEVMEKKEFQHLVYERMKSISDDRYWKVNLVTA